MNCRHCANPLRHVFLDLGFAPPSNAYLGSDDLRRPETHYPLKLFVCGRCWLVQTEDYADAHELFDAKYAYFSSTSSSWLDHAQRFSRAIIQQLGLGTRSLVIEVASNDGYLLRNFVEAHIPCLGIEPTASTAAAAEALGIPVLRRFFGSELARELVAQGQQADLIVGNNVYAHVPDINDFTLGIRLALKPGGTVTLEFPHLMRLIEFTQFDTVYHEHFSYLCLATVCRIFAGAGLRVFDVEELPTHGGSLRVHGCHADDPRTNTERLNALLAEELRRGLFDLSTYLAFQARADRVKDDFVTFLIEQKREGRRVAAYGAAAKGNTLLNYAGIRSDLLSYICDAAPSKQGRYTPGTHIPILHPDALLSNTPDVLVILPWNIAHEIRTQLSEIEKRGVLFVVAVPHIQSPET